jgi:thiol-disulfide isomerase/thioredoxin
LAGGSLDRPARGYRRGGGTLSLGSLRASGKPTLLVFTDPNCGPCQALLPEVGRWQRERAEGLTISLISQGEPEQNRAQADEHGLGNVVIQEDSEVTESYGVWGTRSAVVVLPDGSIGSPLAAGVEQIVNLAVQHAQAFSRPERANHPLSPAPPVRALRPASR